MKIQRNETESKGEFYIEENGQRLALMTYSKVDADKIIIDHTEVDPRFRGKGVGEDLVAEGVKFARENNLKVFPACPFAKKVIDEKPEFQDVL